MINHADDIKYILFIKYEQKCVEIALAGGSFALPPRQNDGRAEDVFFAKKGWYLK